jgi:SAM-dependent methyltransferase
MIKLGGTLGAALLQCLSRRPGTEGPRQEDAPPDADPTVMERAFGRGVWRDFAEMTVLDFGCGCGRDAVTAALEGARQVFGIDVQPRRLEIARQLARQYRVEDRCHFLHAEDDSGVIASLAGSIDHVYSIDSFEHFSDPEEMLAQMNALLTPGGRLRISFGPPWGNPYGSHMRYFCPVPWIHLFFTEWAVMTVRSRYRDDGALRYSEVDGGLNRMTVRRFRRMVRESGLDVRELRLIPFSNRSGPMLRTLGRRLDVPIVRELITSTVVAVLDRPLRLARDGAGIAAEADGLLVYQADG